MTKAQQKKNLIQEIQICEEKQSEAKKDSWVWHEFNGALIAYRYVLTNYYD